MREGRMITISGILREKRILALTKDIQIKIKKNNISGYSETSLKKQKRQLKYDPKEGNMFTVITYDNFCLTGVVLKSHVGVWKSDDYMSVVILKPQINIESLKDGIRKEHVLVGPRLVDVSYWRKGIFSSTEESVYLNVLFKYAFCEEKEKESWIDENGNKLEVNKYEDYDYLSSYAYTMMNGMARAINEELIINGYK